MTVGPWSWDCETWRQLFGAGIKFQSVKLIDVFESTLYRIYQYLSSIHMTQEVYECVCMWNQLYCGTGNKGPEQPFPH